jgi:hypothetical protein
MIPKTEIQRHREKFLENSVPEKRRIMVGRAFEGILSPREAIKTNCFLCDGMDAAEAARCSVILCPLYAYNGYRLAAENSPNEPTPAETEEA